MAEEFVPAHLTSSKPASGNHIPAHLKSSDTRKTGNYSDYSKDYVSTQASFDSGKYDVEYRTYPSDLMSDTGQYGGNYAVFYINVSDDSKLLREEGNELIVKDQPRRDNGELYGAAQRAKNSTAFTLGGLIGTGALGGSILGSSAKGVGLGVGVGFSIAAESGEKFEGDFTSKFKPPYKRIKTAIALHMPNNMNIRYGVNWDEAETLVAQIIGTASSEISAAAQQAISGEGGAAIEELKKQATGAAIPAVAALGLQYGGQAGALAGKLTGLAANPKKEQIFRNVDVRTFQIDYQFFPRNAQESANIQNIIKQFKYHMHPEYKDENAFLYVYPSEFDIAYYNGTDENLNVHRHTSCVLTEMNINYTPQGRFNSFEGGMPTQINMVLTFRELVPLTKERIKDGL